MKHLLLLAGTVVLAACAPAPEAKPAVEAPGPHAFEIGLTLTPRAADKLVAMRERVVVDAMYFGLPVREDAPGIDAHGEHVALGADRVEVDPANAVVKAPGTGFDATHIKSVRGEPEVLVNVYSARRAHADNLLSCGSYQGPVTMAQKQPVAIACDLIDGPETPPDRLEPVWGISNERLMFGLPNSGDITITFSCAPGSGRVKVETRNQGTDGMRLYLASGDTVETVAAARVPPDGEWIAEDEVVSTAEVALADPVLAAFRKSGALSKGSPPFELRTATAAELGEIEAFFAFCEG